MSTGGPEPLPSLPGRAVIDALAAELRTNELVAEPEDGREPVVTHNELQDLAGGALTRTEVTRLQRLCILEMVCRGTGVTEIGRRLRVGKQRLQYLLRGILSDGIADDRIDQRRGMVRAQFQWNIAEATKQYKETGNVDWLRQRSDDLKSLSRLDGLNKPVPIEVQTTKQVAVELRVITSREQLTTEQSVEQAAVGAAVQGMLAAETAIEVESADGTEASPDGD